MSEAAAARRSGNPAKKAAAPKRPAKSVKQVAESKIVIIPNVEVVGEKYQMRASKYLMIQVMDNYSEMSQLAEQEDDQERELDPAEMKLMAETMKGVLKLFDRFDANGAQASSQDRIMDRLDTAEIDFDDLTDAFNKMASHVKGGTGGGGRPLG